MRSDDIEKDSNWWDDVATPVENGDDSWEKWRDNPVIDALEVLRPLLNLEIRNAAIVFLHNYYGASFDKLGEFFGVSKSTVHNWHRQAVKELKDSRENTGKKRNKKTTL